MTDTALRSQPEQIDALTGIRGVAALWVAFLHLQSYRPDGFLGLPGIREVTRDGWLAVDLFFVLSGFIMMHVHGSDFATLTRSAAKRFLVLRFIRIYPAHFAVLLLHLPLLLLGRLIGATFSMSAFAPSSFVLSLLMLNGWGVPGSEGWNIPSWSVSSEWFAYLMFPAIAFLLSKVERRALVFVAGLLLLGAASFLGGIASGWTQFMLPFSGVLFRVTSEFSLGCLAYRFYSRPIGARSAEVAAEMAVATIVLISLLSLAAVFNALTIAAFVVLVVGLSQARGPLATVLQSRPMVYLGRISYSAYIIHALVLSVYARGIGQIPFAAGWPVEVLIVFVYALLVIASANLLYRLVEEPSRRWLRSQFLRQSVRSAVAQ